jgi:LEA14-like dessication related protein
MKFSAEALFVVIIVTILAVVLAAYYAQSLVPVQRSKSNVLGISEVSVVSIQSISFSSIALLVRFEANNPTPISVDLVNASYLLYGNGDYLGAGVISQEVHIPAFNSTYVESNFKTALLSGLGVIFSYLISNNNQIVWLAEGNATFSEPVIGFVTVHFDSSS